MPNRLIAPDYTPITSLTLPEIEHTNLDNSLAVLLAKNDAQAIFKMEMVFEAGSKYQVNPSMALVFSKLLLGGTKHRKSQDIYAELDQYGGFVEISQKTEQLYLTIYGLERYFDQYLNVLQDIIENSIFPEEEIEHHKKVAIQTHKLNLEKPSYLGREAFRNIVFGNQNPYGKVYDTEQIEALSQSELLSFYAEYIQNKSFTIFLTGHITEESFSSLNSCFGQKHRQEVQDTVIGFEDFPAQSRVIERKDKLQSTVILGRKVIGRSHEDFNKLRFTNSLFAGYFGSRLMKNIREEKGYTYGISGSVVPTAEVAYWMVATDVVKENTLNTLQEIDKEISLLQQHLVDSNEMETVRNYMMGSLAGSMSNIFEVMDWHKIIYLNRLNANYFDKYITEIQSVNSQDVLMMAQKYFDKQTLTEVVVGERI